LISSPLHQEEQLCRLIFLQNTFRVMQLVYNTKLEWVHQEALEGQRRLSSWCRVVDVSTCHVVICECVTIFLSSLTCRVDKCESTLKLLIRPQQLWKFYQQSSSNNQEEWTKKIMNLALRSIFAQTFKWFLHAVHLTTWSLRLYFTSEGRRAAGFIALKNPRLRPGLNR
jgi:hypothetical protein